MVWRHSRATLLVFAALLLVVRSFVGAGVWGDEPYSLSTTMRYLLGDRPLVDSWDTNFSSAIMAMPFLKAFLWVAGSTDAVLLAFRGVWVLLTLTAAAVAFWVLRDRLSTWMAAAVAALLTLYIPFLSSYVGYGADYLWHILASFVAVRLLTAPPRVNAWYALPGMLTAVGVIGNPTTITAVPLFVLALWLASRKSCLSPLAPVSQYLIGGIATGSLFLLVLRLLSGPSILSMLSQLTQPDDHDFSLAVQIAHLRQAVTLSLAPLAGGLLLALARRKSTGAQRHLVTLLFFIVGALGAIIMLLSGRLYTLFAPQGLVYVASMTVLVAGFFSMKGDIRTEQFLLVLPALGAGIGWFVGSNAGWESAVLASPLLFAAALYWWPDSRQLAEATNAKWLEPLAIASIVSLIVTVAAVGVLNTPEGPTLQMTSRIERGPFMGMFTTSDDALLQHRMIAALASLPAPSGRTAYLERYPLGYLIEGAHPGTYSTWMTSASSERLQTYVALTGNYPTRIVLTRFGANLNDGEFPSTVNLEGFPEDFQLVAETEDLRVFDPVGATGN